VKRARDISQPPHRSVFEPSENDEDREKRGIRDLKFSVANPWKICNHRTQTQRCEDPCEMCTAF
jgi:hypothetical protein